MTTAVVYDDSTSPPSSDNVTNTIFNMTDHEQASPCLVLQMEGTPPWNNPTNLISAHTEEFVDQVKYSVILPILFLIGGPANVINMAVFYRQGMKERINVCLFVLSLADFLFLLCNMVFYAEQAYLQLSTSFTFTQRYGPFMRTVINHNLISFYGLPSVTQVISALIASERCCCVLWPLRSHSLLSYTTTATVIVIAAVITLVFYSLVVTRYRVVCFYDPVSRTVMWNMLSSQFYLDHQEFVDYMDVFLFGLGVPVVMMVVVVVTTIVTMVKLRQAAAWRAGTSSSGSVTSRDVGVTVMLVYNSIFFIVCLFPSILTRFMQLFIPELRPGKEQHNLLFMMIWVCDAMDYVNATFNIVVYYTMGSRYRQTFWQLMGRDIKTAKRFTL
ncbi:hypothetical protein ACOMHN_036448 [Nucella lapillus]